MGQVRRLERVLRELDELAEELGDEWGEPEFDGLANARSSIRRQLGLVVGPLERAA